MVRRLWRGESGTDAAEVTPRFDWTALPVSAPGELNKRSILGVLAWAAGAVASLTPRGVFLGLPLVALGVYLVCYPQ